MRRFITASDVELVYLTGQRTFTVDADDVVTGIAKEMATKLGVKIVVSDTPEAALEIPSASSGVLPEVSSQPENDSPSVMPPASSQKASNDTGTSQGWIPLEFRDQVLEQPPVTGTQVDIVLKNGNIVWPGQGIFRSNVLISNGKIVALQHTGQEIQGEEIDVSGKFILPGIIDPHVHMGIFAPFEKDIKDETKAGLWGGVTSLGCFLYDKGSYIPKLEDFYSKVKAHSSADVFFHPTIASEEHLAEIQQYVENYGIRSFKMYMCGVEGIIPDIEDSFMQRVYEKLESLNKEITVCIHAENASLVRWATEAISVKDGMKTSVQEWSETHPAIAEEEAIRRALFLTKEFRNIATYFVHVSTKGGIETVSKAKCEGRKIYAETTSPYLLFHIENVEGNLPKWLPPLRNKESQEALWQSLERGGVDSLGTDSVPMSQEIKGLERSVWEAMPNAPSLEHHLPGLLTEGQINRGVSLPNLVDLMTRRPAEIFGVFPKKGILWPGADADLVVVDMEKWKRVDKSQIRSGTPFSLFEGKVLAGWPDIVIKAGKLVVKEGDWVNDPPPAKVLNETEK